MEANRPTRSRETDARWAVAALWCGAASWYMLAGALAAGRLLAAGNAMMVLSDISSTLSVLAVVFGIIGVQRGRPKRRLAWWGIGLGALPAFQYVSTFIFSWIHHLEWLIIGR